MKTQMQVVLNAIEKLESMPDIDFYDTLVTAGIVSGEETYSLWGSMGVDYDNYLLKRNLSYKDAIYYRSVYLVTWRDVFLKEEDIL
ncbi:hypothetical protein [Klebsiella phage 05F01]|nr:hypothetical protein [Klebsiella phage 05F01]